MDQRGRFASLAHPERTDALRPVDLVGGDSDQVGTIRNRDASETLHRIAEHERTASVRPLGDLPSRLDDSDFIVDQHRRDQRDPIVQLSVKQFQVNDPVFADRQHRQINALTGKPFAGVEHRRMLGRDCDNSIAAKA